MVIRSKKLHAAGCAKIYSEKVSGARTDRVELGKLLKRLDENDVLQCASYPSRFSQALERQRVFGLFILNDPSHRPTSEPTDNG